MGTGVGTSIKNVAEMVCQVAGEGKLTPLYERVVEGEYSVHMPTRRRIPQELKQMVLSYEKGQDLTGFSPKVSLEDGIREEYEWLCKNPQRWDMDSKVQV